MSLRTPFVFFNFPPNLTPSTSYLTLSHLIVGTTSGPCILFHITANTLSNQTSNSDLLRFDTNSEDGMDNTFHLDDPSWDTIPSINYDTESISGNESFQPFSVLHGHESKVAAITSCVYDYSRCAVTLSVDGTLCIWNIADGRCMAVETYLLNSEPTCCCILPGKQFIAVAGQTQIEIVDLKKLRVVRVLEGHTEWIQSLDAGLLSTVTDTEETTSLLSVGRDTCIKYWATSKSGEWNQEPTFEFDTRFNNPVMVCHSRDWNIIVLITERQWIIYRFQSTEPLFVVEAPPGHQFCGGRFVTLQHLFVYTNEGMGLLYKLPQVDSQTAIQNFKETIRSHEEINQKDLEHPPTILVSSTLVDTPQTPTAGSPFLQTSTSYDELSQGKNTLHDIRNSVMNALRRKRNSISLSVDTNLPAKSPAPSSDPVNLSSHDRSVSFSESPLDSSKKAELLFSLQTPPITPLPSARSIPSFGEYLDEEGGLVLQYNESYSQGPQLITSIEADDDQYENQYFWSVCRNFISRGDSQGNFTLWSLLHLIPENKSTPATIPTSLEIYKIGTSNLKNGWPVEYVNQPHRVTASHFMIDKDRAPKLIHGMSDGTISIMPSVSSEKVHQFKAHDSKVTSLLVCHDTISDQRILISGSQDGSIKLWEMSAEETVLLKTFYVHSESVTMLFVPPDSIRKKLSNGFVSIGDDRSVVFFSIKRMEVVHVLGGHSSDVASVYWRPDLDYVLVRCTDGFVFVWHFSTGLLERRLGGLVAHELIEQAQGIGGSVRASTVLGYSRKVGFVKKTRGFLESLSLIVSDDEPDIQLLILSVRRTIGYINSKVDAIRKMLIEQTTDPSSFALTSALGYILQYGKSNALDLLRRTLHIDTCYPQAFIGLKGAGETFSLIVPKASVKAHPFKFSPILSASYTISCVSILNALSKIPELERMCNASKNYYLNDMPRDYKSFEEPSFLFCAQYLKDTSKEVQDAARATMIAVLNRMKPASSVSLAEKLGKLLMDSGSTLSSNPRKQNVLIALAVLGCHNANAIEGRIASLTTRGLLEIMENGGSQHLTAIQLLGEAYHVWKYYLSDHLLLFQRLFQFSLPSLSPGEVDLSTTKGIISKYALEAFAAITSVDSNSYIDFISEYLSNPNEKPPVMVYSALTSIEPIVKIYPECIISHLQSVSALILRTLDRNFPQVRNASIGPGRRILRLLVESYPMVSYHQSKQRFGIGTTEGTVIIFDLKTTSKWQHINAHKGPIAAIAMSPAGNLLATYAPMDFTVRLWSLESSGLFSLMGVRALKTYTLNNLNPNFSGQETLKSVKLVWLDDQQTFFRLSPGPNMNPVNLSVK